ARDLDALARRDRARLVAIAEPARRDPHGAALEQRPHGRTPHAQVRGQHDVEARAGLARGDLEGELGRSRTSHGAQGSLRRARRLRASVPVPAPASPTPPTRVQVMDTTLRDGEQTPDVSYTPVEKLQLARMLLSDVRVDRIEIAQTRVSEGERLAARRIASWAKRAGLADRV